MSKTTTTTPVASTPASYLMWVGKQHYPTIADYVNEATEMGISKRVANADVALNMTTPGTLVYLAHDEGVYNDCDACLGELENPERRKAEQALLAAEVELENRKRDRNTAESNWNLLKDDEDEAIKTAAEASLKRTTRLVENAKARVAKLTEARDEEPEVITAGTGGYVILKDGSRMDYRRFNYWLHQPKKWDSKLVEEDHICKACGGHGRLPVGKVFGVFMPADAEYILRPEDSDAVAKELKDKGVTTVKTVATEPKRGCGKRKPGGTYVVTRTKDATPEQLTAAVKELTSKGLIKPEDVKVNGGFVEFVAPVDIDEKRFRGIKSWTPVAEAAEEAEMIAEAVA